ncbi:MAG: hypothetical protein K0V04_21265, partial [Deltaproteobacteria bacterium]|nr:hypothetical protein [Deltaproteobacteria bacterium]
MVALFQFFGTGGRHTAAPLAFLNGTLILDSGESDATFLCRCQDRYLTYACIAGWRSLMLVKNDEHRWLYDQVLPRLRHDMSLVARLTGWFGDVDVPRPLFVPHDLETLALHPDDELTRQLRSPMLQDELAAGIVSNQVSPLSVRVLSQLGTVLSRLGIAHRHDEPRHHAMA